MKIISAILPILWLAVAQAALAGEGGPSAAAEPGVANAATQAGYEAPAEDSAGQCLAQSLEMLQRQGTLSAKLSLKADLFGQQLAGTGIYYQQAGDGASQYASRQPDSIVGLRLRLELRLVEPNQASSGLLYVGDGRNLWRFEEVGDQPKLSRIDIWKVRDALERGTATRASPTTLLTLGGLPKLIAGLRDDFQFAELREGELGENKQRVWVLDGTWKKDPLARLLPEQKEAIEAGRPADLSKLPRQAPGAVQLVLGKDDLLPYRLEYRRPSSKKKSADSGDPDQWQSLAVIEFFDFERGAPLDSQLFEYRPNNIEVTDQTDVFLKSLGLSAKGAQ